MDWLTGNPVAHLTEYELRHLAEHLVATGRATDLHRLLALETEEQRNAWHEAKDAIGDMAGYVADVAQARRLAEEVYSSGDSSLAAQSIGLQIRYTLLISCINSLAQNIPPVLLGAMVNRGLRSALEGLAYARQIPSLAQRAEALVELVPHLPGELHQQAFELAQTIERIEDRAVAIIQLAPFLPESRQREILQQVFREAQGVKPVESRATILTRLVPYLVTELNSSALDEARAAVQQIADVGKQADLFIEMSLSLPASQRTDLLREALSVTQTIRDVVDRATRLARLATYLPEPERTDVLERTLEAAQAIDDPFTRVTALAILAPHLPEALRADTIRPTLKAAQDMQDPVLKATTLATLAPYLSEPARTKACQQVLRMAQETKGYDHWTLITLVSRLATLGHPKETLEFVRSINAVWIRADALGKLARHLPGTLMGEALATALEIWSEQQGISGLGQALIEGLVVEALAEAQRAWSTQHRGGDGAEPSPMQWLAAGLLDTKYTVEDENAEYRALQRRALVGLVPYLPAELLRKTLVALAPIDDRNERIATLTNLLWHLPRAMRDKVLEQMRQAALEMADDLSHAVALMVLAPYLDDSVLEDTLKSGLKVAQAVEDPMYRGAILLALAPHLPAQSREQVLRDAHATLTGITEGYNRPTVLAWLAPYTEGSPQETSATEQGTYDPAARIAIRLESESDHPESITDPEALRQALATALKSDTRSLTTAIETLIPSLMQIPTSEGALVWREALHTLAASTRPTVLVALRSFAPFIAQLGSPEAVAETFYAIQDVGRWWP